MALSESDTLISISKYFGVSLDFLMKEEDSDISESITSAEKDQSLLDNLPCSYNCWCCFAY